MLFSHSGDAVQKLARIVSWRDSLDLQRGLGMPQQSGQSGVCKDSAKIRDVSLRAKLPDFEDEGECVKTPSVNKHQNNIHLTKPCWVWRE